MRYVLKGLAFSALALCFAGSAIAAGPSPAPTATPITMPTSPTTTTPTTPTAPTSPTPQAKGQPNASCDTTPTIPGAACAHQPSH